MGQVGRGPKNDRRRDVAFLRVVRIPLSRLLLDDPAPLMSRRECLEQETSEAGACPEEYPGAPPECRDAAFPRGFWSEWEPLRLEDRKSFAVRKPSQNR